MCRGPLAVRQADKVPVKADESLADLSSKTMGENPRTTVNHVLDACVCGAKGICGKCRKSLANLISGHYSF